MRLVVELVSLFHIISSLLVLWVSQDDQVDVFSGGRVVDHFSAEVAWRVTTLTGEAALGQRRLSPRETSGFVWKLLIALSSAVAVA